MFSTMKLESFLADLSSSLPAPGGGAVAAVSGSLGASLVAMACNLTSGKKAYAEVEDLMGQTIAKAEALRDTLLQLADQDAEAFNALMASYKTEGTPEEKAQAVEKHLKLAAEAPWQIAVACGQILALVEGVAGKSNPNLNSDLEIALEMALTGMRGGIVNVRVNLALIKDLDYVETKEKASAEMLAEAEAKYQAVLRIIK